MQTKWMKLSIITACLIGGATFYGSVSAQQQEPLPTHKPAQTDGQNMVVQLCDGETNLEVKGVRPDERLSAEKAQAVSNQLMNMWLAKQPKEVAAAWAREAALPQQKKATTQQNSQVPAKNEQPVDFSARDYSVWKKELDKIVQYGDQIFHDDKLLDSTNGVSCAMCHPHGANTHAETYPKFQIQLGRVALLRDMINWCIENPSRGKKLDADDAKMRALEAYLMAQRKGVPMEAGKH